MGFFLLLIVVLGVILMIFKIKGNDTSVRFDAIEFDTQKTVQQITGALRSRHISDVLLSSVAKYSYSSTSTQIGRASCRERV